MWQIALCGMLLWGCTGPMADPRGRTEATVARNGLGVGDWIIEGTPQLPARPGTPLWFTYHVTPMLAIDSPVTITLELPPGVDAVEGQLIWSGQVTARQPISGQALLRLPAIQQTVSITVTVHAPYATHVSREPSGQRFPMMVCGDVILAPAPAECVHWPTRTPALAIPMPPQPYPIPTNPPGHRAPVFP